MILFLLSLQLAGCVSPKRLSIFQGMEYDVRYEAKQPEDIKLQPFDRLEILVLSEIPQLAAPFNAALNFNESSSSSARQVVSYEVDREGCIEFPKLGPINVVGLSTRQLEDLLEEEMKSRGYIKDATVKVTLQNFEITVIGERNEQMSVVGGMNLVQLLARTGGPDIRFRMDDVMVIRTENGARQAYQVDLCKKEVFDSPVFYLQQNDIVYLKPRSPRQDPTVQALLTSVTPLMSAASLVTSILVLLNISNK